MSDLAKLLAASALLVSCGSDPRQWPDLDAAGVPLGPVCRSGNYWPYGERGDNHMHPGRDCIGCHTRSGHGPVFTVAGTIFNAPHEVDDCFGYDSDTRNHTAAEVQIVDGNGVAFTIIANRSGNFYTTYPLRFPLRHVQVRAPDGSINEMFGAASSGDCNSCHTRLGTVSPLGESPGRVTMP